MIKIIRLRRRRRLRAGTPTCAKLLRRRQAPRRASTGLAVSLHYKIVNSRSILKNIDLASPV
jgi:hypothetical protein